jgi:hypothetical protein
MKAYLQFGEWGGPYQTVDAGEFIDAPMPHHKAGLTWTATGYGAAIPTTLMVRYKGHLRRVYCRIYSNGGTCFVRISGKRVVVSQG